MSDRQPQPIPEARKLGGVFLYVIGVVCIFASAYYFVTALWHFFLVSGSLISNLTILDSSNSFPEELGTALAKFVGALLFGTFGGLCWSTAKRASFEKQTDDGRAPVIYLRSFRVDKSLARRPKAIGRMFSVFTEEEQLVRALREMGPVVAIGRPGEEGLPKVGAHRIYVDDAHWQQQIRYWFTSAALVVLQVPSKATEGVTWEIDQSLNVMALDRLVFLVSQNAKSLDWLNQKLRDRGLTAIRVRKLHRGPYGSAISGVVHFKNGQPEFRALVKPPFFNRPFGGPMVPVYRAALQPVTTRITRSWRPLPRAFGDAFFATTAIVFCILLSILGVRGWLYTADPVNREFAKWGQRFISHLPAAEARQSREKRDLAALGAWMQTHVQDGLRYVPDDVAVAEANVVRQLVEIASPADCAAIADGTMTRQARDELLHELGKRDLTILTSYFSCQERKFVESLKPQHVEAFPISRADAAAAFAALYEKLSEEDVARFRRISANFEQSSAEDHCWWMRTLFQGAERLEEPSRSKIARIGLSQDIER